MNKRFFLLVRKIILFLIIIYITTLSLVMSHYFVCDYYYEKFRHLNEKQTLSEKEVEEILFLFSSKITSIEESPSSYILHPENGEYIVRYSFLLVPSIEIIYSDKKQVVTYIASYE